jgi:hypothetical protein
MSSIRWNADFAWGTSEGGPLRGACGLDHRDLELLSILNRAAALY